MEKVLDQEQIDALVRAAREGGGGAAMRSVESWDARRFSQLGKEQVRALSQIHESFARTLTYSLGALLGVPFGATLVSAENLPFTEFLQRTPELTYLSSFRVLPLDVSGVLQLDLGIAFRIIDVLLGGQGLAAPPQRLLTEIEEQILESVTVLICRELEPSWNSLRLEFRFERSQPAARVQKLIPLEEKALALSFEISLGEARGSLNVVFPAVVSNALLRKLAREGTAVHAPRSAGAAARLREKLAGCPFDLDLELVGGPVALEALRDLEPGQVLALGQRLERPAALRVAGIPLLAAFPARWGEKRAAQVAAETELPRREEARS
jgi:flagellar motor switch protein FliM